MLEFILRKLIECFLIFFSLLFGLLPKRKKVNPINSVKWNHSELTQMIQKEKLSVPCVIVDLDALDKNIEKYKEISLKHSKNIRIATKSIRVPNLIQYIGNKGGETFQSLMCYNINEAELIVSSENNIFTDILIAYPIIKQDDIVTLFSLSTQHFRNTCNQQLSVTVMVDCMYHLYRLSTIWQDLIHVTIKEISDQNVKDKYKSLQLRICIDYDMSLCFFNNWIHLGTHRSPIYNKKKLIELLEALDNFPNLQLTSIMGYEAQISGLPTNNPFVSRFTNFFYKIFQSYSKIDVLKKRAEMMDIIQRYGYSLEFINGGGSGSFLWTMNDPNVSEVSVGSGFLQSSMFDWFDNNQSECALIFAIECTRKSMDGSITCQSGGFIASGAPSKDKYVCKDFKIIFLNFF